MLDIMPLDGGLYSAVILKPQLGYAYFLPLGKPDPVTVLSPRCCCDLLIHILLPGTYGS